MGRFEAALRRPGLGAIAEIKRRSPSAGDLRPDADPARIAPAYAAAGAAAISVLVDERFAGSWDDLRAARAATDAPLLAKGFFSTPDDLRTAKRAGADAVLLLLRDLDDAHHDGAHGRGIEASASTRWSRPTTRQELERAIALEAPVVGVNARDLATFAIDRAAQLELVAAIPSDRVVIAESGIDSRAQGAAAELAGADAILVGSTLMRAPDPAAKLAELLSRPLVKVCGLTREEDVAAAAESGADLLGFVLAPESPRAAEAVLPVPDATLAVAVWVGAAGDERLPISTRCTPSSRARSVAATRRCIAPARRSPESSTSRGARTIRPTGSGRGARTGRIVLAGGLGPENVAAAIAAVQPWAVDASSSLERAPGIKDHGRVRAYVEAARAVDRARRRPSASTAGGTSRRR